MERGDDVNLEVLSDNGLRNLKRRIELEEDAREDRKYRLKWKKEHENHPCVDISYSTDLKLWITENIKHTGVAVVEQMVLDTLEDFEEMKLRAIPFTIKAEFTTTCTDGEFEEGKFNKEFFRVPSGMDEKKFLIPFYEDFFNEITDYDIDDWNTSGPNEYYEGYQELNMVVLCPESLESINEENIVKIGNKKWTNSKICKLEDGKYRITTGEKEEIISHQELQTQNFFVETQ